MSETASRTHIKQLGTVVVPVADQDRALEFYIEKLGFEKRADVPFGNGDRWIEVAPPGAETSIALMPPRESQTTGVETRIILISKDIEADFADLRARGVDTDPQIMRMGDPVPPMLFLRDCDKNSLAIVELP